MKEIIAFFIRQHKVAHLIVVLLIVVGGLLFWKGPKEAFPPVSFDIVVIATSYLGASASEVETLVTSRIEEAIEGVNGKKRINSSSVEGASTVVFELDPDTGVTIDKAVADIKTEMDRIRNDLPSELEADPFVLEIDSDVFPILAVIVSGNVPEEVLRSVADAYEEEVNRIPGVSRVEKVDYRDREVWVEVSATRLRKYDLEIGDVIAAIRSRNINLPGGKIVSSGKEYLIRTVGQYEDLDDIKQTVIRANDSTNVVLVKDVATVRLTFEKTERSTRIQGHNGIILNILKKRSHDIIQTSDAVKDLIKTFEKKDLLPAGVRLFTADDLSFYVKRRLGILVQNATLGLVLVFLCLIFFFDFKTTFWTTVGVPIAFCTGMIFVSSAGITLNLISMFGFIIVVGMIVDDAIVVSENIYRHKEMGKPALEAAIIGTREVLIPVTGMVFTTVIAFAPMLMLSGIMGKFLGFIPKVVIATMVASYFECLLILPGHMAFIRRRQKKKKSMPTARDVHERRGWFQWVQKKYEGVLTRLLRRPLLSILGTVLVCIGILYGTFKSVPFVFFPGRIDELYVKIEVSKGTPLERMQQMVDEVEGNIRKNLGEHVREYISSVGFFRDDWNIVNKGTHYGTVRVVLDPDSPKNEKEIIKSVEDEVKKVKGIETYSVRQVGDGPPRSSPIFVQFLSGEAQDTLSMKAAADMKTFIEGLSNVVSVEVSIEEGKEEYRLRIDEATSATLGVNASSTALAIRHAFDGGRAAVAKSMKGIDEDVDIIVKYPNDFKKSREDLQNVKVKNTFGQNIALSQFARIETGKSINKINKENLSHTLSVTAELINKRSKNYNASKLNKIIMKKIPEFEAKYPGIKVRMGGDKEEQARQLASALVAMLVALMGVLIVLTSLFKSYVQPFVVMGAIPFAFVGLMLGLLITQTPLGFFPLIGMIALTGVVVNDTMVLVSFINKMRSEGHALREAIIMASVKRLRPIMLTTLTTAVGLAPLAYGILGKEPFLEPMAIAILWGLCFSTFVILGVIPCLYYVMDSFVQFLCRLVRITYKVPGSVE